MDDSETLTIFIGHRCSDQLIQKLFGYVNFNSMPELIVSSEVPHFFIIVYLTIVTVLKWNDPEKILQSKLFFYKIL